MYAIKEKAVCTARKLKSVGTAVVATAMVPAANMVHALDDAEVTSAFGTGSTSVTNGSSLYIGLVAIVIGLGLIVGMFRKT